MPWSGLGVRCGRHSPTDARQFGLDLKRGRKPAPFDIILSLCGGTVWQGHTAMRISVSSWATTEDDVEKSLEAMLRIAAEVRRAA